MHRDELRILCAGALLVAIILALAYREPLVIRWRGELVDLALVIGGVTLALVLARGPQDPQ